MGNRNGKFSVKLNNTDKVEQLLQEVYDLSCQQYNALQNEINKISNTTVLADLDIDGKEKYGKITANYYSLQQKANAQKADIARLMTEVIKHNGDIKGAIDAAKTVPTTLDLNKLRKLAMDASSTEAEEYQTKK